MGLVNKNEINMKTAQELITYIKSNNLQEPLFDENISKEHSDFLGNIEQKDCVINSDTMFCVIYFADHDIYLKLTGEYDSYGGGEHDYYGSIKEVKPQEKTITEYI